MSVEFYRDSPGKFDSRILNRKTLNRWTGRRSESGKRSPPDTRRRAPVATMFTIITSVCTSMIVRSAKFVVLLLLLVLSVEAIAIVAIIYSTIVAVIYSTIVAITIVAIIYSTTRLSRHLKL